eukprot:351899-Chlamydomonas_euryale.AAC.3
MCGGCCMWDGRPALVEPRCSIGPTGSLQHPLSPAALGPVEPRCSIGPTGSLRHPLSPAALGSVEPRCSIGPTGSLRHPPR